MSFNRPRRPNPETIAYLRSLPLDITVVQQEIDDFLAGNGDFPPSLAAALSAIDEIRHEIASLAGEEHAASIIELLATITSPVSERAARVLLHATAGYRLHLASHRFGSHVLQTILDQASRSRGDKDLALHEDAPPLDTDGVPMLTDLLLDVAQELSEQVVDMAAHQCGSHVLRTLLCVMAGVTLVNDRPLLRRGKKKKKHKTGDDLGPSHDVLVYETNSRIAREDGNMAQALEQLTTELTGSVVGEPGPLQQMACHESAGPLLATLLRVWTYHDASEAWKSRLLVLSPMDRQLGKLRAEPHFAEGSPALRLAERILCWQSGQSEQPFVGDVIYGLAGEARGSRLLETLLQLCPDDVYSMILQYGRFDKSLSEYIDHDVSNFVVQTLLATTRTQEQTETLLESLKPLIESGVVLDTAKKRRGIVWRAVEAAAKHPVGQKELLLAIRDGFQALHGVDTVKGVSGCVPYLLAVKAPDEQTGRLELDVPGARALHYLLRFEPDHCKDTLKGILRLSEDYLELLAKDGLGSRCVWDGILEGAVKESCFTSAMRQLITKLKGRWVALATDRVGHHCVTKLFRVVGGWDARKQLVSELSQGKSRLTGNAMGRSVLDACFVHEYLSLGEKEWKAMVNKKIHKEEWLNEILADDSPSKKETSKKRKDVDMTKTKDKKRGKGTVDNIMAAMTIPQDKHPAEK